MLNDERITVCSTCMRSVADPGDPLHPDFCSDPALCRQYENHRRESYGRTPLDGPIIWFHSPVHLGAMPDEMRESLRQQQIFINRYTKIEKKLTLAQTRANLFFALMLIAVVVALWMTLEISHR